MCMKRKLNRFFHSNQVLKTLDKLQVSQNVSTLNYNYLKQLQQHMKIRNKKRILLDDIKEGLCLKNWTERLKYAIILHYLIINFPQQQEFTEVLQNIKLTQQIQKQKIQKLNDWINTHVVNYYLKYVMKRYFHKQLFEQCESIKYKSKSINLQNLQCTVNGFKILNLIIFILQTQENLNKLGRYFPDFVIIMDLFKMYLNDIKIMYYYLRTITQLIYDKYSKLSKQMLNHNFIYLIQMQRINDRLYQFFHNRYYIKKIKETFGIPIFFKLDYKKYKALVKYIKIFDPNIKISTIQDKHKYDSNQTSIQQPKYSTINASRMNDTVFEKIGKQTQINVFDSLNENFPTLKP